MDIFPKKYDGKKTKKNDRKQNGMKIMSPFVPMDQKITPGVIFSLYLKDLFLRGENLFGKDFCDDIGFGLSSLYYSKNTKQKNVSKDIKANKKFFDKLGFDIDFSDKVYLQSEEFNLYLRDLIAKLGRKISFVRRLTWWSKKSHINLADSDIVCQDMDVIEYSLKYFIESKGTVIPVVTTHLDTIFGDVALAVNPIDKRYKKYVGQNVIIPLVNRVIPIIADESVDLFVRGGVWRVTPGHDERSQEIAQKYNLNQDVYAIDVDGNFTENAGIFSGKSLDGFFQNVETYVDDIGNLLSKKVVKGKKYFNKYTGEELFPLIMKQWVISYDYAIDYLNGLFADSKIVVNPDILQGNLAETLDAKNEVCLSNKSENGLWVPVIMSENGDRYFLSDENILEYYHDKKDKSELTLTLIIINMILDNVLSNKFSPEDLIDKLFSPDFLGETMKLEKYIKIYGEKAKLNKLYGAGLKSLSSLVSSLEKNSENIKNLIEILEDSFAIKNDGTEYYVDYDYIFGGNGLTLQNMDTICKGFVDSVGFCFHYGLEYSSQDFGSVDILDNGIFCLSDKQDLVLESLLLGLEFGKKVLFKLINFHETLVDVKGEQISNYNSKYLSQDFYENLNVYGVDVLRLVLLFGEFNSENRTVVYDTSTVREYNQLLEKIWNANRYIFKTYDVEKCINIKNLLKKILLEEYSDYDLWILHNIKIFFDELGYLENINNISLGKKIFQFFKDIVCDKYLQAVKLFHGDATRDVVIFVFALFDRLIEPYVPIFAENIYSKFEFDWTGFDMFDINQIELKEKNYKVNILMDVVDKLISMKIDLDIKKHEISDLLIQANPDFLGFMQANESLLKSLINLGNVEYLGTNTEVLPGYTMGSVINIGIGLKKTTNNILGETNMLKVLEQEYEEKSTYLQHLKNVLISISSAFPPIELIEKKKNEIKELQAELDDLNYRISILKSR